MSRLEMVRAKEYCEKTTSYLRNGKEKSTFLVLGANFFSLRRNVLSRRRYFFRTVSTFAAQLRCCGWFFPLPDRQCEVAAIFFSALMLLSLRRCGGCLFPPRLLSLGRGSYRLLPTQWTHGKKFMSARFTAQRWNTQQPSEESYDPRHVLRRNALQFEIAADPAMRIYNVAQR
jgi:hypothetical protein